MSFGGAVKLTGESEYRKALQNISQSLREVSAQMKLTSTEYDKNDKSSKALAAQSTNLNNQLKLQTDKVKALESQYKSMGEQYNSNAQKHSKLVQEYNKEKTELDNIGRNLGTTSKEYQTQKTKVEELAKEVTKSSNAQEQNAKSMSNMRIQIANAQGDVNKTTKALNDLGNEAEDSGKQAEKGSDGFTVLKGVISNLASKAIASAISGLKQLGQAIIKVGKESIESYAEYEQLVGGVETLFKDSAGIVQEYAAKAYKTAGVSANKYMEQATSFSASLLQGLGGDTAKAAQLADLAITDMADNANKMGTSIEMIQNAYQGFAKGNFTMLDNLKLGFGGTKEEMARLINESGVMGDTLITTGQKGNFATVSFAKMIEAINVVQQRMGITGTTAKEAASTIQGSVSSMKASWSNLLTAIADDNADLGKSIDEFVGSVVTAGKNLVPRVKQVVEGIKKLINSIVNEVFPRLKKEIPQLAPLIDTFNWFIKNKTLVVGAITAMVTAFALNKILSFTKGLSDVAKKIIDVAKGTAIATTATNANTVAEAANTTAKVAATGATGALTAATNLLNAAWKANPIGLVITGVTALIGVFSLFMNKTEQLTEAEQKHQSEMQKITDTLDDYKNKIEETDKARQEYLDNNLSEVSYYDNLYKELKAITDENGKVQEGYEKRADFIVSTLNDALGTEIRITDNVISNYQTLEEKINDVINAKRAQVLVEANEGKYNAAKDEKVKLEEAYSSAVKTTTDRENERNKALQEMSDYLGVSTDKLQEFIKENGKLDTKKLQEYRQELGIVDGKVTDFGTTYTKLNNAIMQSDKAFKEANTTLTEARETYMTNQVTISDYENALINLKDKNYQAVFGIYEDTHTFIGKTDEETYNNYQNQINMQEDYIKQLKANKEGYDEDYIKKETERSNAIIKNLQEEQAKYKQGLEQGLKEAEIVWSDSLAEQLSDITGANIKFEDAGKGNVQMYIDGEKSGEPKAKAEMSKLITNTIKEITNKNDEAKKAGENLIDGVNNGVRNQDKQSGVFAAISNFGSNLLQRLRNSLSEHSPSKATKQMGQYLLEGLGLGIDQEEDSILKQVTDFGKSVIGAMNSGLSDTINTSAITDIGTMENVGVNGSRIAAITQAENDFNMIEAFKTALSQMKIELDDEVAGEFVERTVTKVVYN